MNKKNLIFSFVFLLFFTTVTTWAQTPPPPPGGAPPGFPIDGGMILLVAVAISYGVSKKR